MECQQKEKIFLIKKVINQKKWTKEEDLNLIKLVKNYNGKNWKEVASFFHNKTPLQCFSRYKRIRPGINKGTWKKEEDKLIVSLVEKYGKSWSKISKIIQTRNGKQIRDRYLNILDPNINKKKFSVEEDYLLIQLYEKFGPKWAKINQFFHKRTTDMIKNRFYSSLKKKYDDYINNNNNCKIFSKDFLNCTFHNFPTESSTLSQVLPNNNNLKELSTIKLSYQPSLFINKSEKDERKNVDLQSNLLFNNNNEVFDIFLNEEDDY